MLVYVVNADSEECEHQYFNVRIARDCVGDHVAILCGITRPLVIAACYRSLVGFSASAVMRLPLLVSGTSSWPLSRVFTLQCNI